MAQVLELPAGDGKHPGVVILHEWWGVNEQMQATAKRYAEEGMCALVVDLYHGKLAKDATEASTLMTELDRTAALADIAAAVATLKAHARCTGKVAVTGYCMGGALTFRAAAEIRGLACTVPFYGLPGDLEWSKIDAPVQAHFARDDDWATVAGAEKIKAAVTVPMELHVYEAKHAFCNERRPEVYNAEAAALAWGRALAFIRQHTA
jgi:carboxymethylenebutenolidase